MSLRKRNGGTGDGDAANLLLENGEDYPQHERLKGDEKNIAILFFLYLLQGIPLGLMQAIPIILTNTGVSYKQQAQFSLVNWPFSLKLLWAPIVDCLFWPRMGRRKSWLVPIQYLIGIVMLLLSGCVNDWLGLGGDSKEPRMELLAFAFFCLNFLAATQDIVVDGWALTMLKRQNVSYASTCNSVGQTAGYFLGYVAFIALESASFCNTYIRSKPLPHGIVTLPDFLWFWGLIFLVTTTLVWLLKSERDAPNVEEVSIVDSYKLLLDITNLKPIRLLMMILLTAKVGFSACDAVTGLKLIEAGVPKEKMALLALPLMPLQIILPLYLSRHTAGPSPMNVYLSAYPYRLGCGLLFGVLVWWTPSFVVNKEVPIHYYVLLLLVYCIHQVALYSMFVSQMAFFAKISDPAVGGTYMTLVNTLANLGGNWPQTLSLWLVDGLTYKSCTSHPGNDCGDSKQVEVCEKLNGKCVTEIDGYYVEMILCTVIGCFWLLWGRNVIRRLQTFNLRSFSVVSRYDSRR